MRRYSHAREASSFAAALLAVCLSALPQAGLAFDEVAALQQRGMERVDAFVAHVRKTGDPSALLPELDRADAELSLSDKLFVSRGDWAAAALSRIRLGDSMRLRNRWPQAIVFYREAYDLAKRAGHTAYEARARIWEARAHITGFNDLGAAGAALSEALELSAGIADKKIRFDALDSQAQLELYRGDLPAAFDAENRALAVAHEANDKALLYYGYLERGSIYEDVARQCDYRRDFEWCYKALDCAAADYSIAQEAAQHLGFDFFARTAEDSIKLLTQRRQLIDKVKDTHEQTLKMPIFNPKAAANVLAHEYFLSEDIKQLGERLGEDTRQIMPDAKHLEDLLKKHRQDACVGMAAGMAVCDSPRNAFIKGQLLEIQGQSDAALESYLRAVDLLEKDRGRLRDERGRGLFLDDKIGFYYQPILHFLSRRRHAEAFNLLERSRARALADLLASRELTLAGSRNRELYARLLGLRGEIARIQEELFSAGSLGVTAATRDKVAANERRIEDLENQHSALTAEIAASAPGLRELVFAELVSLDRLQELAAREGFDVLQYLVLEHAVIVWRIGANGSQARSVFLPRSVANAKVAALRKSVTSPTNAFDEETARQLFLFLVQPVLAHIESNHLVIIPHDTLHNLPFQALLDPADGKFLGEKFRLTYAPSATILAGLEKAGPVAGGRLFAVINQKFSTAPRETQTITALYPDRNEVIGLPTETELRRRVAGADLVHLSVHGAFNAEEPLRSYLELSSGSGDDGRLTAAEMFGLPLGQTRLIVLSACESGEAKVTNANETLGMVRALLYAGAKALVLSLWRVDSGSTAEWMDAFYRAVQTEPAAEAARRALAVVRAKAEYRHPFHWAAFQLVGR